MYKELAAAAVVAPDSGLFFFRTSIVSKLFISVASHHIYRSRLD